MGGRGGNSRVGGGGGGGGGGGVGGGVGGHSLSQLTKGKPATVEEALKRVNPNWWLGSEWQYNCQRCVYAYEMQRRGYDVEAMPRILNGNDPFIAHWDDAMEHLRETSVYVGGWAVPDILQHIQMEAQRYGVGARGFIYVAWKNGSAHVFNYEVVQGTGPYAEPEVKYYDSQVGNTGMNSSHHGGYVDEMQYFGDAKPDSVYLYRTDDKEFNDWIDYAVKKRKPK